MDDHKQPVLQAFPSYHTVNWEYFLLLNIFYYALLNNIF